MPAILDAPIPGESLTREPGNAPWEQPALYADPQQALAFHMERFDEPEEIDDLLFILGQGMPLNVLVETMCQMGVMHGIHTIDVSLLIAPVIHEYFLALAKAADVDVVETDGPTKEEQMSKKQKDRFVVMLAAALDESGGESEVISDMMGQMDGNGSTPSVPEEAPEEQGVPEPDDVVIEKPRGFIKRRT